MSNHQATYGNNSKLYRSPSAKISYSPGNWKNYTSNNFLDYKDNRTSRDSLSSRGMSPYNSLSKINFAQHRESHEEKQKKKEDMMRRVKEIQSRVLPLIENENHSKQQEDFGWETRMEQRISKLETAIDAMQKEIQIQMEKHIMELEMKFTQKVAELERKFS